MPWAVVNWTNGDMRQLQKKGFYVAEACDGQTDFESLAFLPVHQALLDLLIAEGIAESCQEGEGIEHCQQYHRAENPRLIGLHWSITGLCNLNCRHCYMEASSGRYGELPFDNVIHLIDQFAKANVLEVSLTGGEPFLRKDLLAIMACLAQRRIRVSHILTNGLLITEEALETIKNYNFSPCFQISFDGLGGHEHMRGRQGIEASVIATIHKLRAARFPVVIATCVDTVNIGRLGETYDLLKALDIQSWHISSPQKIGNWRGTTTAVSFDEEANAYTPLLDRWLKDGKPFAIKLGGFFRGHANGHTTGEEERKPRFTPESYDCGSCRENPYLLPDGTLLPCPGYVDTVLQGRMPNLFREDLSRVWSQSLLRTIADMKKSDLLSRNEECLQCELFEKCGIGCRSSALAETGDLMAKDPIGCAMWKMGYKERFRELASAAQVTYQA